MYEVILKPICLHNLFLSSLLCLLCHLLWQLVSFPRARYSVTVNNTYYRDIFHTTLTINIYFYTKYLMTLPVSNILLHYIICQSFVNKHRYIVTLVTILFSFFYAYSLTFFKKQYRFFMNIICRYFLRYLIVICSDKKVFTKS